MGWKAGGSAVEKPLDRSRFGRGSLTAGATLAAPRNGKTAPRIASAASAAEMIAFQPASDRPKIRN